LGGDFVFRGAVPVCGASCELGGGIDGAGEDVGVGSCCRGFWKKVAIDFRADFGSLRTFLEAVIGDSLEGELLMVSQTCQEVGGGGVYLSCRAMCFRLREYVTISGGEDETRSFAWISWSGGRGAFDAAG
jgi:hypothetical protein